MAVLRVDQAVWAKVKTHIAIPGEERFAFLLCSTSDSRYGPVFIAHEAVLVPSSDVTQGDRGWELNTEALIGIVNRAISERHALVEAHYHGGARPRFSDTDNTGLREFVPYILDSLRNQPYAATVWGDRRITGVAFTSDGHRQGLESITVVGDRFSQVASSTTESQKPPARFSRQIPWFSEDGQQELAATRFGIVGASGTGSQVITQLGGLGARRFVVVDPDTLQEENLARVPYATPADIGIPKASLAKRYLEQTAPGAEVQALASPVQSRDALHALKGVDVIVGCVDNDGARLILNETAIAYAIPYLDIGVGIQVGDEGLDEIGATLAVVLPQGPCLNCMHLIDTIEARYFASSPETRETERELGYVEGLDVPAPAVGSLNAAAAAMLVNEYALFMTGARRPNPLTHLDLLGRAYECPSQRVGPVEMSRDPNCFECQKGGSADQSQIERYIWNQTSPSPRSLRTRLWDSLLGRLRR